MNFSDLRRANRARQSEYYVAVSGFSWTGPHYGNAIAGEVGELCNVIKKLDRGLPSDVAQQESLLASIGDEIADVAIYLDLLAEHFGIDLGECIRRKFNSTSERLGFLTRLEVPE